MSDPRPLVHVTQGTRNVNPADLLPYDRLLPSVSVMITNGGWGGVLAALSYGIPLIVAGGDIDKPEIAARLAYAGVGIDLRTGTPTSEQIATAIDYLTTHPEFAARARALAVGLNALTAPEEIRRLIEDLPVSEE